MPILMNLHFLVNNYNVHVDGFNCVYTVKIIITNKLGNNITLWKKN